MKKEDLGKKIASIGDIEIRVGVGSGSGNRKLTLWFPEKKGIGREKYEDAVQDELKLHKIMAGRNYNYLEVLDDLDMACDLGCGHFIQYKYPINLEMFNGEGTTHLWAMKTVFDCLNQDVWDQFYGQNTSFIGRKALFLSKEIKEVQEEAHQNDLRMQEQFVTVAFIGLGELFKLHEAIEKNHDRSEDIRRLAACFKSSIDCLEGSAAIKQILQSGSTIDRDAIRKEMRLTKEFHNESNVVFLKFNPRREYENIEKLVNEMNLECREGNEKDGKVKFSTQSYFGKYPCNNSRLDEFLIYDERDTTQPALPKLSHKHYRLATIGDLPRLNAHVGALELRERKANQWKYLPEAQKNYIEANKFVHRYVAVARPDARRCKFLIRPDADTGNLNSRVDKLRQNGENGAIVKVVSAEKKKDQAEVEIMSVSHHHILPIEVKMDISPGIIEDVMQQQGGIRVGGESLGKSESRLMRGGRTLYFVGSDNDNKLLEIAHHALVEYPKGARLEKLGKTQKPFKGYVLDTKPVDDALGNLGIGRLEEDIIGRLEEDISRELIPLDRQLAAVENCKKGLIENPRFCGILATPKHYRHSAIASEEWPKLPTTRRVEKIFHRSDKPLDPTQRAAIRESLRLNPYNSLHLIHGPPGTGKTMVIVELVKAIFEESKGNSKVLLCSQTHAAADNVLERLNQPQSPPESLNINMVRLVPVRSGRDKRITDKAWKLTIDEQFEACAKESIDSSKGSAKNNKALREIFDQWHAYLNSAKSEKKWNEVGDGTQIRFPVHKGEEEYSYISPKEAFMRTMDVMCSTCTHISSSLYKDLFHKFDYVIIDEASKSTPAESLIPIQFATHLVLIGDHKQLPPYVPPEPEIKDEILNKRKMEGPKSAEEWGVEDNGLSDENKSKRLGESLFEELHDSLKDHPCCTMLRTQRRMHPQIGDLVSKFFYEGKLKTPLDGDFELEKRNSLPWRKYTSMVWIDTTCHRDRADNGSSTWKQNFCNAKIVIETLKSIHPRLSNKTEVAIIAGYRGQVELLQEKVTPLQKSLPHCNVKIGTVDSFQGKESPIVIYDVVRSNDTKNIGFLDDSRRINVAFSRAQKLLIVVGDRSFLDSAKPSGKRKGAEKTLLGEIADEFHKEELCFENLEDALT